jgi:ribosomal protein L37AE/L43A
MYHKDTKKVIKEVEEVIRSYNTCDKCGKEIETGSYDAFECKLEYKEGTRYPEGTDLEIKSVEVCQECTVDLLELLKNNGYNIVDSELSF